MIRRPFILIVLLLLLLPSWAWATAFTSVVDGAWTNHDTWGTAHADPPVEGTQYPGPNDTWTIASGDTVTVDGVYPSTGTFGASTVAAGGVLTHATNLNTKLSLAGSLTVAGTYTMGAVGADIDADKLCELAFTPAAAGGYGLIISAGGAFNSCGDAKTLYRLLASDVGEWAASNDIATSGNVTSIDLDSAPTGWQENDALAIAAMGRTVGHTDTCLVNENPVAGTNIAVDGWQGAAPGYAGAATKSAWNHQGAGTPAQARAEVMDVTRNVRIYSTSATNTAYIVFETTAVVSMNYTQCWYLGTGTADKYGITFKTTTGSAALVGVVVHDSYRSYDIQGTVSTGTIAITDCGAFACAGGNGLSGVLRIALVVSGAGSITVNGLVGIKLTASGVNAIAVAGPTGISLENLRLADVNTTAAVLYLGWAETLIPSTFCQAVTIHTTAGYGVGLAAGSAVASGPITNWTIYRCGLSALRGVSTASATPATVGSIYHFTGLIWFGNGTITTIVWSSTPNILAQGIVLHLDSTCSNPGDSVAAWDAGIDLMADGGEIYANGSTIRNYQGARRGGKLYLNNCAWSSVDGYLLGGDGDALDTAIAIWRYNQAEDDHRWRSQRMEVRTETGADRHTASGMAYEFWPLLNGTWVRPPRLLKFRVPAVADTPITIKVWTKHNAAYDETHPERLVIVGGVLQGIPTDIVGDAHSATDDTWEELTVTATGANTPTETGMLEYVVECYGTAGTVWMDDVSY